MSLEEQPHRGKLDRVKGAITGQFSRRALLNRAFNTAVGVGIGFATGKYALHNPPNPFDNPTIYNPQIRVEGQDQESVTLTMEELATSAQRLDDLGRIINEFIIEPYLGFNSSLIWSQNKANLARLLGSANPKESEASWQFRDKENLLFETKATHTYLDDGGLSESIIRSKFGLAFMASRGLIGTLKVPRVELGWHTVYEDRPRIVAEKLREVADRFVKLPSYVEYGDLQEHDPEGDSRFARWSLTATGKSGERVIGFTLYDNTQYILQVIEREDPAKRQALFGSYVVFDEARGIYFPSPYPIIQKGQFQIPPIFGYIATRDLKTYLGFPTEFVRRPINAQYTAEVFGEALYPTDTNERYRSNDITIEEGRNKHKGSIYYVLMDMDGHFVDAQGRQLSDGQLPYYLPKTTGLGLRFIPEK